MQKINSIKNFIIICLIAATIIGFTAISSGTSALVNTSASIAVQTAEEDIEEAETEGSGVRTTQFNGFSVPVDTSGKVWTMSFNRRSDFRKVSFGYSTMPAPRTAAQFAAILKKAKAAIGTEYVPGGKSVGEGFDCSGFVWYLLHNEYKWFTSASTEGQYMQCYILEDEAAMPGDIVFFNDSGKDGIISHVGLYIGDNKMIHASLSEGVVISELTTSYCQKYFVCFGRPLK